MRKKMLTAGAALLALSVAAWAGRVEHAETTVDLVKLSASGSFYGTRHSADVVQYIGCYTGMSYDSGGDFLHATCYAQDEDGEYLQCSTRDAALVDVVLTASANSHLRFGCERVPYWGGWTLSDVGIWNASYLTGPMP